VSKPALGRVFSEYFSYPCQALHRLLHTHHHPGLVQKASSGFSNSGLSPTPPSKKKKNTKREIHRYAFQYTFLYIICSYTSPSSADCPRRGESSSPSDGDDQWSQTCVSPQLYNLTAASLPRDSPRIKFISAYSRNV
jgi:hypothetical protein